MRIWLLMVYLIAFVHIACGQKIVSFLPEPHTETAVIVCSGGSYFWSANETESDSVARTLQEHGIAAYVLHYRTGGILPFITHSRLIFPGHQYPMPLDDLRLALDSVRRVGYGRVGVMGFSAGGHLALAAALFNKGGLRPDFVVPCYPVVTMREPYVHKRSRPVVDYHNSVLMDSALTAHQVPHRYIQYQTGGHGFGTTWSKTTEEASGWFDVFLEWLRTL